MIRLFELLANIEIQCEVKVCYFDFEKDERVFVNAYDEQYQDSSIQYMYIDNDCLIVELEIDDE